MSVENVTKFYMEVLKDEDLKGKLRDVNEETLTEEVFKDKVLPEAKAKGYDFTYEDIKEYYKKQGEKTELSLDDMEAVAGGGCGGDSSVDKYRDAQMQPNNKCDYAMGFTPNGAGKEEKCKNCTHLKNYRGNYWYCALKLPI